MVWRAQEPGEVKSAYYCNITPLLALLEYLLLNDRLNTHLDGE